MADAVEIRNLKVCFGDFVAVNNINLSIKTGQVFGFLGPNGSGKSTTIKMLCGILKPTAGECFVLGHNVIEEIHLIKQSIGYMSQKFSLYFDLTVQENLEFYAGMYSLTKEQREIKIKELLEPLSLEKQRDVLTGDLSTGSRQRLVLGCAIMHEPKILFLDEPTSGVDPKGRKLLWEIIYKLAARGTTVLITTHFMDEAEHCDNVGFINRGRLIVCGSPKQLKASIKECLLSFPLSYKEELGTFISQKNIRLKDMYFLAAVCVFYWHRINLNSFIILLTKL